MEMILAPHKKVCKGELGGKGQKRRVWPNNVMGSCSPLNPNLVLHFPRSIFPLCFFFFFVFFFCFFDFWFNFFFFLFSPQKRMFYLCTIFCCLIEAVFKNFVFSPS